MTQLPPLRFRPILRDYIWGGRRLATELNKQLGGMERCAESWEIVDHGGDQSVVIDGPLTGLSLHEIVTRFGPELFGRHHPQQQFPLLFKYLDCHKTLSVQVHPNDAQGAKLNPPDLGKTEAWYVVGADPGSKVYAGLKPGIDRATLERALANGDCATCLHEFTAQAGQCILIEAGTVHAIGAGLLIAEIQQASDTTYRLFDWNRVDRDGQPRPLHIEQALDVIDFSRGPIRPIPPAPSDQCGVVEMVACDKFRLDRWHIDNRHRVASVDRLHIYSLLAGRLSITTLGEQMQMRPGDTVLVPASVADLELETAGTATFLDMYLP